jgi:hypothetical protein
LTCSWIGKEGLSMSLPHDVVAGLPRCLVIKNVDLFVNRQRGFAHVAAARRHG